MISATINDDTLRKSMLIVILERDNFDRMKVGDPITLAARSEGGKIIPAVDYPANMSLLIAYEEDDVELYRIAKNGNPLDLATYCLRNHMFERSRGDGVVAVLEADVVKK